MKNLNFKSMMGVKVDNMESSIETLEHVMAKKVKAINGLVTSNSGRGLINMLLEYISGVRPSASKSVVKQVVCFVFFISKIYSHSKLKGVVMYLKACQVLLQQSVGKFRVSDLSELKVRPKSNRSGLPLIIPAGARKLMSSDNHIPTIRLWMTLFGLFSILEFKGKLSFSTITDPSTIHPGFLRKWEKWLDADFTPSLKSKFKVGRIQNPTLFPMLKGGPTSEQGIVNSSPFSLMWSASLWMRMLALKESLISFSGQLRVPAYFNSMQVVAMASHATLDIYDIWGKYFIPYPKGKGFLGKLGFKIEPAGKVRVFAMVDSWTQWILYPLHKWIFAMLAQIRSDGTFNQMSPVLRLQKAFYPGKVKGRTFSSIDLSAATDSLPVSLQVALLKSLLKDIVPDSAIFAESWSSILVDRSYSISLSSEIKKGSVLPKTVPKDVIYAVGQPMGALSSWGMLALTHHAIVQYSAHKAGIKGWFSDYAVLGDDIMIAHGQVAYQYKLLLQEIGVGAGLAKSIVAKSSFVLEFAKKFFVNDTTANMLPMKECIATRSSTSLVLEFVSKYKLSLNSMLAFLGYGYKSSSSAFSSDFFDLATSLSVILVWLSFPTSPLSDQNVTYKYANWLLKKSWLTTHQVTDEVLWSVIDLLIPLVKDRYMKLSEVGKKYQDSSVSDVSLYDQNAPMTVSSTFGSSQTNPIIEKVLISWSKVLGTPLAEEIPLDYSTTTFSSFKSANQPVAEIKPISDELMMEFTFLQHFVMKDIKAALYSIDYKPDKPLKYLNMLLSSYFEKTPLDIIPARFWPTMSKELSPFTDFLKIYKLWQLLSRPVWANYYKTKNSKPTLGMKEGLKRSRALVPVSGVMTLIEIPFGSLPFGVLSSAYFSYQYVHWPLGHVMSMWSAMKDWFLYNLTSSLLTMLMMPKVMCVMFIMMCIIFGTNWVPETPEFILEDHELNFIKHNNWSIWMWLGLFMILIILGFGMPSSEDFKDLPWDGISPTNGYPNRLDSVMESENANLVLDTTFLDPITRYTSGMPGPYSPAELQQLQDYLEVKAFMDNLSISPIGQLWGENMD